MAITQELESHVNGASADDSTIVISFKKQKPLHLEIDIDQLTVGDLSFVEDLSRDNASTDELIQFLKRVLPDVDLESIPLRALPKITDAVMSAIGGATDPND